MIKALLMFVFGNALWDYLVEIFGSTTNVVTAAVILIVLFLVIRYFKEIIGFIILMFILYLIFH